MWRWVPERQMPVLRWRWVAVSWLQQMVVQGMVVLWRRVPERRMPVPWAAVSGPASLTLLVRY
ncbi:MAG TPA: hypothetical protein VLM42_05220 [Bryobacteraceae bacterium]|nr:hypothetical protein [Bryobacteraceae bacterium]